VSSQTPSFGSSVRDTGDAFIPSNTPSFGALALPHLSLPWHRVAIPSASTAAPTVKIATVIAALRQAAAESGHPVSDELLALMIGQLRGAEGAYPGVHSSLGGTNNMGAAQVTKGLLSEKQGLPGWGAFAHKDSDPNAGSYIGWYWIAPSPLEAARHWFGDNWWGPRLAAANVTDATSYATILYLGRYYGGVHAEADPTIRDPNSTAGSQNIADYAAAINRGKATAAEMAEAPDDPSAVTVNPGQFALLDARAITQALFDKAKSGGMGSAWSYLLPSTWEELVSNNGVVWFSSPAAIASASSWKKAAAAGAVVGFMVGGPVGAAGGAVFGAIAGKFVRLPSFIKVPAIRMPVLKNPFKKGA
jgi:hypothetical protein